MQKYKFNTRTETKPSLSRKVVERQRDEHEVRGARLPQRGPFEPLISGIGDASSAGVHASMLNRATNGRPSRAGQSLLRLQRQYGNRYVQRVLALARKGAGETEAAPELEQSIQQARGSGQALDNEVRSQMEPAFGADFSGVRVHTGAQSDTLNRELNARAFTTGQDIFFRQDAYNPGNSSGRELIAHELTHVVQQNGDKVQRKLTLGQPGDKYEQEADQVARSVMQQEQRSVQRDSDEGLVRRQIEEEEEEVQMKSEYSRIQQQVEEEEEEEEEEEIVQTKAEDASIQRQMGEEEESIQAKAKRALPERQTGKRDEKTVQATAKSPIVGWPAEASQTTHRASPSLMQKNDNRVSREKPERNEPKVEEPTPSTYTPEQYFQDAYAWLNATIRAHDRAINQVETTLQDDADVKIDIFKLALTAVNFPLVKGLGTAFKVTIDISKIYSEVNGATNISFRHFAGNVRTQTEKYERYWMAEFRRMRKELKKEESKKTSDTEKQAFRKGLEKDAAEIIPEPPSFRDIEELFFNSWINGHKGNWLYKKPGRVTIKYDGGKLRSVEVEDVAGADNIKREFEDIYKYKKIPIDIANFVCQKWLYIGRKIVIVLDSNNEFIKGHYPVPLHEAISGKDSTKEAKKFWLRDFGGSERLPKIEKFGPQ